MPGAPELSTDHLYPNSLLWLPMVVFFFVSSVSESRESASCASARPIARADVARSRSSSNGTTHCERERDGA